MRDDVHGDVVIVGGGVAGVEALMALADLGHNRLRVRLVADRRDFTLPRESLGVPWGSELLRVDLETLCRAFGARFVVARATGVDATARQLFTADGGTLDYGRLLLAPGAGAEMAHPGVRTLGFGALPAALAADLTGSVAVVVPAGASWTLPAYQLALLAARDGRDVQVMTAESAPLSVFGTEARGAIASLLDRHGVVVRTGRAYDAPTAVDALADTVVALPVPAGPQLAGVPHDPHGFVRVGLHGRVPGIDGVYAAGDATDSAIKQGGLAAQQADVAAAEIVRACGGNPPHAPAVPVLRGLLQAPDGEQLFLLRTLDGIDTGATSPEALWRPPSAICARRLARWLEDHRDELDPYGPRPST